nr:hypothetical protein [Tanacetum cinerariifolium]
MIKVLPFKTAEEVVARERERKVRTTLLMAFLENHLAKFRKMANAKEMWKLSNPDLKFLRPLPSSWSQVALIMRTKPWLDTFSFDDLYNNLRVFELDVKGTTASSSFNTQNVAFVPADNTSSTNDEGSSSYTDEVIHSFFSNQSSAPQLKYDDLKQINDDDMEDMDLKWQVAMISMRIKKFHKKTGIKLQFDTKDPVGFNKTKMECFNCHKMRHFTRDCRAKENQNSRRRDAGYNGNKARDNGRRPTYQDDSKALVTIDGEDIDWSGHVEEDAQNYAMIAYSSSTLGSDNEVKSCSKTCEESYARLKKLYDEQRDKLGDASIEITAYTFALKKSVFMNKESDLENISVNDMYVERMHAVPPLMIGNYMRSGPNVEIDYSRSTYGPKQTLVKESDSKTSEYVSCESGSSIETTTSMPAPIAKRLHDEEVEQATAKEKQEKDDLEKAKVLQQQHVDKQENIDWNVVAEQIQEKHLENIRKYQSLKRKPISIAQARKNMIIYLKNMVGYKTGHFREEPQKKRVAEETLHQESFKKLKEVEVSGSHYAKDTLTNDPKEMSEEDVQNMLEIFLVSKFKVKALQVKYPLIEWEIHSEGSRTYWKTIRVGGITEAHQSFEDMLKCFDREDLDALWRLVKEKFSTTVPIVKKEKALWVELKRLFEPDTKDVLWKHQRYMHYPIIWKVYYNCGVHQVSSTTRRHDMFMLIEKNYPLSNRVITLMLSAKLQVKEDSDMARDLVMKIFMEANKPKSRSLDTSSK